MVSISKETFDFLNDLKINNNREWFVLNRPAYLAAKSSFELFIQKIIDRTTEFDPIIKGLEARNCVYRINRDIRFSIDKSPYKTNFGAFIVRGGKRNGNRFPGYYLHIEPGKCMIAGGAYMPPAPWLSAIRKRIDEEPGRLKEIINSGDFKKLFGTIQGDKLKKAPRGYPSDHPEIELLKYKSYLAVRNVTDDFVMKSGYFDHTLYALRTMKPFNDFLECRK